MSIDTLGFRAAGELFAATEALDAERSLHAALTPGPRRDARSAVLVAACLVLVVVVGWLGMRVVLQDQQSAPPLDDAPRQIVGSRLSVPATASVPDGWGVVRDAESVELRPFNGADQTITVVGQPVVVFEPPDYQPVPLRDDLVVWTTTRSDLKVSDRFGLDGPGFAWTGTQMTLALRSGIDEAPLVAMKGGGGDHWGLSYRNDALTITSADRTFHWDVIYLTDSPPLLVASRSATADDAALNAAREELLQSLQVTAPTE